MSFDIAKRNVFNRRIFIIYVFKAILILIVFLRLGFLQIFSSKKYKSIAKLNGIKITFNSPKRGKIYDRNKVILADVKVSKAIIFNGNIKSQEAQKNIYKVYNIIYKKDVDKINSAMKKVIRYAKNNPYSEILVYKNLNVEEFTAISFYLPSFNNIEIQDVYVRVYTFSENFVHLIGYVKSASKNMIDSTTSQILKKLYRSINYAIGSFGVELAEDKWLSGEYGLDGVSVSRTGKIMSTEKIRDPVDGNDISISVDSRLQLKLAEQLEGKIGGGTVIDIETGEILALHSAPSFNPNIYLLNNSFEEVDKIMKDKNRPFFNRCLMGLYAPGSLFKPCVAMSAVSHGWNPNQQVNCSGSAIFGKREYHCWKKEGHGKCDLNKAIAQSCNIYFYTIGSKMDIDNLYNDAYLFGFDQKYELGIGQAYKGCIPNRKWKKEVIKESWFPGDTINSAVGQGYNQVSVLQLAVHAARIASGKVIIPSIWKEFYKINNVNINPLNHNLQQNKLDNIAISEASLKVAQDGMYACVNESYGTLFRFCQNPKYKDAQICAKTGTAQIVSMRIDANAMKGNKFAANGLFFGYAPYDKPKYAIAVVVEGGIWGSISAAPVGIEVLSHAVSIKA